MTWEEFKTSFAILAQEYKHELKESTPAEIKARMDFWYREFQNIPNDTFVSVIKQIIRTNKFFPKLSEIFEILHDEQIPKLDVDTEFDNAIKVLKNNPIRRLDYICPDTGDLKAHITTLDDILGKLTSSVAKTVRSIGIERMMNLNDRVWVKKEFAEALNDARDSKIKDSIRIGLNANPAGGIEGAQDNNRRIG